MEMYKIHLTIRLRTYQLDGLTVAMMVVFEFPPRESCKPKRYHPSNQHFINADFQRTRVKCVNFSFLMARPTITSITNL